MHEEIRRVRRQRREAGRKLQRDAVVQDAVAEREAVAREAARVRSHIERLDRGEDVQRFGAVDAAAEPPGDQAQGGGGVTEADESEELQALRRRAEQLELDCSRLRVRCSALDSTPLRTGRRKNPT